MREFKYDATKVESADNGDSCHFGGILVFDEKEYGCWGVDNGDNFEDELRDDILDALDKHFPVDEEDEEGRDARVEAVQKVIDEMVYGIVGVVTVDMVDGAFVVKGEPREAEVEKTELFFIQNRYVGVSEAGRRTWKTMWDRTFKTRKSAQDAADRFKARSGGNYDYRAVKVDVSASTAD
jgi:hypothetical protein